MCGPQSRGERWPAPSTQEITVREDAPPPPTGPVSDNEYWPLNRRLRTTDVDNPFCLILLPTIFQPNKKEIGTRKKTATSALDIWLRRRQATGATRLSDSTEPQSLLTVTCFNLFSGCDTPDSRLVL